MKDILNCVSVLVLIIASISLGYGFDLKKWQSWIYILCGFLFGFLQLGGIGSGVLVALLMIWGGPIALKHREKFS